MENEPEKTENQIKKEYLQRYKRALMKEQEIESEIREIMESELSPSSPKYDGMPHGTGGGDLSDYEAKVEGLLEHLKEQMNRRIDLRLEISKKIEEIPDETESLLMRYRYIHGMKWEEIATHMGYGYRNVLKMHGKALKHFRI